MTDLPFPDKIMLVDGPLAGQVTDRPDTGTAYVRYLPPAQIVADADQPVRFMNAAYQMLRCEVDSGTYWIGSVGDRDGFGMGPASTNRALAAAAAACLKLPEAEQCRERRFYLLVCRECGDGDVAMPFDDQAERGKWAGAHTRGTGHDRWFVTETAYRLSDDEVREKLREQDAAASALYSL